MTGAERRSRIIELLRQQQTPLSGAELAKLLGVSRQIIVQDIALMRAEDKNVLSTNKGYLLFHAEELDGACRRVFYVRHRTEDLLDELTTITELGGRVLDVSVEHEVYGQIRCDLIISSKADAEEFAQYLKIASGNPLKNLTDDRHYHTVVAPSERLLDLIEHELSLKGYLI